MRKVWLGCLVTWLVLAACKKQNDELSSPPLSDYFPLQVGKYIVYRLDSTVLLPFGTGFTTHSYRVKDVVDAEITDNRGRKSYRIYRSITDTNGVNPYRSLATYFATPQGNDWIEYVDNNMRFMKLRWPVSTTLHWKGNSFFATPLSIYDNWEYHYDNIGLPYTILGKNYANTLKVMHQDTLYGVRGPITYFTTYQEYIYSSERYAKGIGLIEKNFFHYLWTGNDSTANGQQPVPHFDDNDYGIHLRIIDHN